MSDEKVPEKMQAVYDEITALTDAMSAKHLNQEYADLSRKMAARLARKRPSPLAAGKAKTWAAEIIYALGQINFLFDKSQTPYISPTNLCKFFDVNPNTASDKAHKIRDMLKMRRLDHEWMLPSELDGHPVIWLVMVNGLIVDIRHMPRVVQEEAYRKGIIPYIPADQTSKP